MTNDDSFPLSPSRSSILSLVDEDKSTVWKEDTHVEATKIGALDETVTETETPPHSNNHHHNNHHNNHHHNNHHNDDVPNAHGPIPRGGLGTHAGAAYSDAALETLALMILRTKHSHELAAGLYKRRQSLLVFYPLQLISLATAMEGIAAVSVNTNSNSTNMSNDGNRTGRASRMGIDAGTIAITVLGFLLGLSGMASLILTNLSKRWNFECKAKSHQIMTRHMKWQLDELDMIRNLSESKSYHTTTMTTRGSSGENDINNSIGVCSRDTQTRAERIRAIELSFQTELRMSEDSPPRRIEIAYQKLKSQLDILLRPSTFGGGNVNINGNVNGNFNGNNVNVNTNTNNNNNHTNNARCQQHRLSHHAFCNIVKLGYSELAIVLGDSQTGLGITLPNPDDAVLETMHRLSTLLRSAHANANANANANDNANDNGYHAIATLFPPPPLSRSRRLRDAWNRSFSTVPCSNPRSDDSSMLRNNDEPHYNAADGNGNNDHHLYSTDLDVTNSFH